MSTSVSSLEADSPWPATSAPIQTASETVFNFPELSSATTTLQNSNMSGNNSNPDITVTMDTLSRDLQRKQLAVQDAMEELTEEDVDNVTVHTVERDLDRILERRDEFRNAVRDMLIDYGDHLEVPAQTTWKTAIASLNS